MRHFGQSYGPLARVIDSDGLPVCGGLDIIRLVTADEQIIIPPFHDKFKILIRSNARVHHHEDLFIRIGCNRIFCYYLIHHIGQRIGVGGIARQYGAEPDEAFGVDCQCKHEQTAVAALLHAAAELRFYAVLLAPLEIEVGQVEEHHLVCQIEPLVDTNVIIY